MHVERLLQVVLEQLLKILLFAGLQGIDQSQLAVAGIK
jgi:hypothetical protein